MLSLAHASKALKITLSGVLVAAVTGISPGQAQEMTAGVVMEKLPTRERTSYIMGLVEGLAYARFERDSAKSGEKDQSGLNCIHGWFYGDSMKTLDRIEAAFRKYSDHYPAAVLTAIIKKECGG